MTGRDEILSRNNLDKVLIPSDKWNASAEEIYKDALFQVLNPLVRIPKEYCRHYRKRVTPLPSGWKQAICVNCGAESDD